MQLKTDKCNFIHLGRCVKSSAPNIPHDSPWLIFPWSETPIISHEPNSTRMAQCSPRGQFSGHLPLTHRSCGNQPGRGRRDGRWRRGGDGAAKRGWRRICRVGWRGGGGGLWVSEGKGGEVQGYKREQGWGEQKSGVEWIWRGIRRGERGDWVDRRWRPVAGHKWGGGYLTEREREREVINKAFPKKQKLIPLFTDFWN